MFWCKTPILIISLSYENWSPFKRRILAKAGLLVICTEMDYVSFVYSRPYNLSFVKVNFSVKTCKKEYYETCITPSDSNILKRTYSILC